jgi:prepilin-type processing-associated H-X9-DG protein
MQFRLSTLFLVFFNVAASLALFGVWGILVSVTILLAALSINHAKNLGIGIFGALTIVFFGLVCTGLLTPQRATAPEAVRRMRCMNNLTQIGQALHNYYKANEHFPKPYSVDQEGKPLMSWRIEILPMMGNVAISNSYSNIYNSLKKDEPWNSPENAKLLNQVSIKEFVCPSAYRNKKDYFTTNYIAVIGPGTAWNEDKPVKLSDLPYGGSHTVMVIEVVNSGVNWAEPRDLTVEDALERMKTAEGLRISAGHPSIVNVLFADGSVKCCRKTISISGWKKLFAGDVKNIDSFLENEENDEVPASDVANLDGERMPSGSFDDKSTVLTNILSFVVWLFSVVLLFRRAVKSRRKPVMAA